MDKSPVYLKYGAADEFDPQLDFAQFLKEAKTHGCQEKSVAASLQEEAGKEQLGGRTKPKRSWKSSIFPWLKADKKSSKPIIVEEQETPSKGSYSKSKSRRGYVSGPMNGINGCSADRPKRPTSGPLLGLFNQRKRMEDEIRMPYISLGQLSKPRDLQSYGPVYLVT